MSLRKGLVAVVGIVLACGMGAAAATTRDQSQTDPGQDETLRKERIERMQERREPREQRQGIAGHREMARHGEMGRRMRELNLTEQQLEQRRAIMERRVESTKVQREELFRLGEKRRAGTLTAEDEARAKTLHQELRSSMESVRSEMDAVLTSEQKAKLEQLENERKQDREQRRQQRLKERQERLKNKPMSL
jgi:Spy/CpxP family protein refolding chaperone